MDRIVQKLAKINFNQNIEAELSENCAPYIGHINMATLVATDTTLFSKEDTAQDSLDGVEENAESWEDISDEGENASSTSAITRFSQRRNMPSRVSKENSLNKIQRRSIQKPTKRNVTKTLDFSSLRPADIKKIYMNKKITNFRPSNLETIFEEEDNADNEADTGDSIFKTVRLIGGRKLKRSLSCSDGVNINKTLIKQRRAKIKKAFGRRFALKKISLEDFITQFKMSSEDNEIVTNKTVTVETAGMEASVNVEQ